MTQISILFENTMKRVVLGDCNFAEEISSAKMVDVEMTILQYRMRLK